MTVLENSVFEVNFVWTVWRSSWKTGIQCMSVLDKLVYTLTGHKEDLFIYLIGYA